MKTTIPMNMWSNRSSQSHRPTDTCMQQRCKHPSLLLDKPDSFELKRSQQVDVSFRYESNNNRKLMSFLIFFSFTLIIGSLSESELFYS